MSVASVGSHLSDPRQNSLLGSRQARLLRRLAAIVDEQTVSVPYKCIVSSAEHLPIWLIGKFDELDR